MRSITECSCGQAVDPKGNGDCSNIKIKGDKNK